MLLQVIGVLLARYLLDDRPQENIPRVVILEFGAGIEFQRLVLRQQNDLRGSQRNPHELRLHEFFVVGVAGNSGSVSQQLLDGDALPGFRARFKILAGLVVHRQLALLLQLQNRRGGKLLGDRSQPELRGGRVGDVPFHVRHAVPFFDQHLATLGDQHRTDKAPVLLVGFSHVVELGREGCVLGEAGGNRHADQRRKANKWSHSIKSLLKSPYEILSLFVQHFRLPGFRLPLHPRSFRERRLAPLPIALLP